MSDGLRQNAFSDSTLMIQCDVVVVESTQVYLASLTL